MEFVGITIFGGVNIQPPAPPPLPSLYSWGTNTYGQLGIGNTTSYSSPKQVGALATWYKVDIGGDAVNAIKTDGTLWAWGRGYYLGNLGLGTFQNTNYSSPVQVGALTNWASISRHEFGARAIKTDGTLWVWGRNYQGGLGLGNATHYDSPKQVGALTNWLQVSGGYFHTVAVKTNGTLWVWGRNSYGSLGLAYLDDYTSKSSPVQVGGDTNWTYAIAYNLTNAGSSRAIKTDGTLWAWGRNIYGNLGLGDVSNRSNITQVGGLNTWSKISGQTAIKTDGTMWAWGYNGNGELGLGDTTNRSSPVQIGALTTWSKTSWATAIKTDGTLWSWGYNADGRLGLGDTTSRSSPTQVGTKTSWTDVSYSSAVFAIG